jgi:uncharacterized protein
VKDPNAQNVELRAVRGKGRGVFARRAFRQGQIIERAPAVVIPGPSWNRHGRLTLLEHYCYQSGARNQNSAVVLGYVMLYNHAWDPNANLDEMPDHSYQVTARRDIRKGDEILVNYNGEVTIQPGSADDIVWFKVR